MLGMTRDAEIAKPVGDAALGVPQAVEGDRPYNNFADSRRILPVRV